MDAAKENKNNYSMFVKTNNKRPLRPNTLKKCVSISLGGGRGSLHFTPNGDFVDAYSTYVPTTKGFYCKIIFFRLSEPTTFIVQHLME